MTINKKFDLVKARTFGLLHQLTVPLLDAVVSCLTTPLTTPLPCHTPPRRRGKTTVTDPSDSLMVMLWCRLNRHLNSPITCDDNI
jgi:hypothetical protein